MLRVFVLYCLCWLHLNGVFGSAAKTIQPLSVTEGDSITLHANVTELRKGEITWKFGSENSMIALIHTTYLAFYTYDGPDGRFRDRLKLDNQTGSLTITDIKYEHAGLYKVEMFAAEQTSKEFSISVYARLPVPGITRNCSSVQYCSVVCSVVNVSVVSLSWYKGNSLLSSISVSDLSISLSLPLEMEYQENNTYSCVINNTISNHTTHMDICQPCEGSVFLKVFISAAVVGCLLTVAAVGVIRICNKKRKTDQEVEIQEEEITYAETLLYKRNAHNSEANEEDQVEYGNVAIR